MNRRRDLDGGKLMNPGRAGARRRLPRVSKTRPGNDSRAKQSLDQAGAIPLHLRMVFLHPPPKRPMAIALARSA